MKIIGEILKEKNIQLDTLDPVALRGFTQVPNFILENPELSLGARITYSMFLRYAWHKPRTGKDGFSPLTLAEWVEALVSDAPHLFEANAGGGATGSGSRGAGSGQPNPWSKATLNLTEQVKLLKTDPGLAARLKASA